MIQIAECDGCEVISCIVNPNSDTLHALVGVFVCRYCLKMKGWNQCMSAAGQDDDDARMQDILGITELKRIQCPYGKRGKLRFATCVACFENQAQSLIENNPVFAEYCKENKICLGL